MAPDVVFMAADREIATMLGRTVPFISEVVDVRIGYWDEAVREASKAVASGAKVVLARWVTAEMLRSCLHIPVIEVPTQWQDLVRAADLTRNLGASSPAFVGYWDVAGDVRDIFGQLGIPVATLAVDEGSPSAFQRKVRAAVRKGADLVLGGSAVVDIGQRLGYRTLKIAPGPRSILEALRDALAVTGTISFPVLMLNVLARWESQGVIGVDAAGKIRVANSIAQECLPHLRTMENRPFGGLGLAALETAVHKVLGQQRAQVHLPLERLGLLAEVTPLMGNSTIYGAAIILKRLDRPRSGSFDSPPPAPPANLRKSGPEDVLPAFCRLVSRNTAFCELLRKAGKIAQYDVDIFLVGETGTGKDLLAKGIHEASPRRKGPFVAVNCASLPQELLESELFGYEFGAFTGARRTGHKGRFQAAEGGTLFLDEITELPPDLQPKLLRVVENRVITPLGGEDPVQVNVRIIAASNRSPATLVGSDGLRPDLFFRLCRCLLHIPPLRERPDDIAWLTRYFYTEYREKHGGSDLPTDLPEHMYGQLQNYPWPGNVRELRNVVEMVVISLLTGDVPEALRLQLDTGLLLAQAALPAITPAPAAAAVAHGGGLLLPTLNLADLEQFCIARALDLTGGNKRDAAKKLGISETTLWRRVKSSASDSDS